MLRWQRNALPAKSTTTAIAANTSAAERPTAVELLAHVRGSELMAAWLAHARAEPPAGGVWVSPPLLSEAEFDSSAG